MRRVMLSLLSALAIGCASTMPRPHVPSVPAPPVIETTPQIAVLTVEVIPPVAVVTVRQADTAPRVHPTRADGRIVEEFPAGGVYQVTASAPGYVTSDPVTVTMTAGQVTLPGPIVLVKAPEAAPLLRRADKSLIDENGVRWTARGGSGLALASIRDTDQDAYLDYLKCPLAPCTTERSFNLVRVMVGSLLWANGQTPASALSSIPAMLGRIATRGLVALVTILTDTGTGYDPKAHLVAVADLLQGRRGILVELANEFDHPTQRGLNADQLRAWGREIFTPRGILWSVGASIETDEACPPYVNDKGEPINRPSICANVKPGVYVGAGGDFAGSHLDRREPWPENVRRIRELLAITEEHGIVALNQEMMGCDDVDPAVSRKQRWNDPAPFFAAGALDYAFGSGGVHHSESGRYAVLPGPIQRACAIAYLEGHAAVTAVIGNVRGVYKNVDHSESPVVNTPYGEQAGARLVRAFSFLAGNRAAVILLGIPAGVQGQPVNWGNGWRFVRVVKSYIAKDGIRTDVVEVAR